MGLMIDWDCIVREAGPGVWRTVRRIVGNHADAEEVWQETFVAALELTRRSREPVNNWPAMLIRIATARAIDRLRQRIGRSFHEGADATAVHRLVDHHPDSRPSDRAEQAELSQRLREALTHLPPKQADAFCLRCLERWNYSEVAEHLDESVDNVGVLIHRARAALKEQIAIIIPGQTPGVRPPHSIHPASDVDEVSHER
jgi:RNA polymerase sigma-70 factor (ECF subfamily)